MFSATVYAFERLFMQQADHAVLACDALKRDHEKLLMITRNVRVLVKRRNFVLARSHFIVPRFNWDAQSV